MAPLCIESPQNCSGKLPQVRDAATAQRRHVKLINLESIVQVLAEPSLRSGEPEVDVCCRDHANVERYLVPASQSLHCSLLQGPQKLHLQVWRQVANLVQEYGTACGTLERPGLIVDGPGERPAHVTEQFILDKTGGEPGAVDDDERSAPSARHTVNRACHAFFPRAGFPEDQNGDITVARHAPHVLLQPANRRRRAIDLREGIVLICSRHEPCLGGEGHADRRRGMSRNARRTPNAHRPKSRPRTMDPDRGEAEGKPGIEIGGV